MSEIHNFSAPIGATLSIERCRLELGGVSRSHIYTLMERGDLDSIRIGRRRLVLASSMVKLLTESKVMAGSKQEKALEAF